MPLRPDQLGIGDEEQGLRPLSPSDLMQFGPDQIQGKQESAIQAGYMSVLKGLPGDPQSIEADKLHGDVRRAADAAAGEYYQRLLQETENTMRQLGSTLSDPVQLSEQLNQGIATHQAVSERANSPVSTERAVVEQLSADNVDESRRQFMAGQLAMRNDIAQMTEANGWVDDLADGASLLFLPFKDALDIGDVADEIEASPELATQLATNSVEGMVTSFKSLPIERQMAVWPHLKEAVLAASGSIFSDQNRLRAGQFLLSFLAPEGGAELRAQRDVDIAFGALDLAGGAGGLAKLAKVSKAVKGNMVGVARATADYAQRANNPIKLAANLGDSDKAASISIRAMVDDGVAESMGMSRATAANNGIPTNPDAFSPEKVNLSVEMAERINDEIRIAQGHTRSMVDESESIIVGALSDSERRRAISGHIKQYEKVREDFLNEGIHMSEARLVKTDQRGAVYEYDITNTKELKVVPGEKQRFQVKTTTHTGRISWKVNDVNGAYTATTEALEKSGFSALLSPSTWSRVGKSSALPDFGDEVQLAAQLENLALTTRESLSRQWADASKGVSRKNQELIGRIEIEGDEYINPDTQARGRVFSENELMERGLVEPQAIESYYRRRVIADQMHELREYASRRELELGGFGQTRIMGQEVIAKMFDDAGRAKASIAKRPGQKIFVQETKELIDATPENIDLHYGRGARLVRTRKDFNTTGAGDLAKGGVHVEYVLINGPDRMRPLGRVVGYHPGYVPKIHEGVEFVVRRKFAIDKPGVKGANKTEALRAFASRADADRFLDAEVKHRLVKEGLDPNHENFDIAVDALKAEYDIADGSAMTMAERMEEALSSSSGTFVGTRAKNDLLMGLRGVPLERMDANEAFKRYFSHLGNVIAKNEWRIGTEKRWLNTVRKAVEHGKLPGVEVRGFSTTIIPDDTKIGKALNLERETINHWHSISTKEESVMQQGIQKFHDWMLDAARGYGYKNEVIPAILTFKHVDPVTTFKLATMHSFLGFFNPAQLYVQASAAVVGLSLVDLKNIPRVLKNATHWGMMDLNKWDGGRSVKWLQKKGIFTAEEAEMYALWRKSGLYDSILANADTDIMKSGGFGRVKGPMGKFADTGLQFWKQGELVNRRISFMSALDRFLQANPKLKPSTMTNQHLLEVTKEANKTMLTLQTANRAWWQGGRGTGTARQVLGMATQFQQVMAKTLELAIKGPARGGFTPRQKMRIAMGQLLMFGAAGVPLLKAGSSALEWMYDEGQVPEEAAAVFNQGLMGGMLHFVTGQESVDLAGRAALLAGVFDFLEDLATNDDPLYVRALGAGATFADRTTEALSKFKPFFAAAWHEEIEVTEADVIAAVTGIARISSTGNNLWKAYLMHNSHIMLDRYGRRVDERDFSMQEEIGKAFGFQLTDEQVTRIIKMENRDYDELALEGAQAIIEQLHELAYLHDNDPKHAAQVQKRINIMLQMVPNAKLKRDITELVAKRMYTNPQTIKEREMKTFFERTASEDIVNGMLLDAGLGDLTRERAAVQPFANVGNEEQE